MKGWKDPSGTASEHLGLPIERLTSGCLKNASLAVDDLAGQLLLWKPAAAPHQELRVALVACPFHSLLPSSFPWCSPAVGYLSHRRQPLARIIAAFARLALPALPNAPCFKCQDGCWTIPALPATLCTCSCSPATATSSVAALPLADTTAKQ